MSELQVTARMNIRDGQLEAFQALAADCMKVAREMDSGTLQYDWFVNADQTEYVVRERYRDSAAALEHVANLGEATRAGLTRFGMSLEFYGEVSDALIEATKLADATFYNRYQSI